MSLIFSWILIDEISIGTIPKDQNDISLLKSKKIKSIISLANYQDKEQEKKILTQFKYKKIVLPDHRSINKLEITHVKKTINLIKQTESFFPLFIHCEASIERSPLIALAWLMHKKNISLQEGLDYMMSIHSQTNPLPEQIKVLSDYFEYLKKAEESEIDF